MDIRQLIVMQMEIFQKRKTKMNNTKRFQTNFSSGQVHVKNYKIDDILIIFVDEEQE